MAEDVECRRCGQAVRQTVRVDTPEGYRRLCRPCFEVLGDWINGTGAELACPVWSCRERFHSHHDETAATSLLYHLEAEHEWLIDFLSGKLGGAELRTDGGIESSGSYQCPKCNRGILRAGAELRPHDPDNNEREYVCDWCGSATEHQAPSVEEG